MIKGSEETIGFFGILTIIFIVLKLTHTGDVANWSWIWIVSPLWIPAFVSAVAFLIFLLISFIIAFSSDFLRKRKNYKDMMNDD